MIVFIAAIRQFNLIVVPGPWSPIYAAHVLTRIRIELVPSEKSEVRLKEFSAESGLSIYREISASASFLKAVIFQYQKPLLMIESVISKDHLQCNENLFTPVRFSTILVSLELIQCDTMIC